MPHKSTSRKSAGHFKGEGNDESIDLSPDQLKYMDYICFELINDPPAVQTILDKASWKKQNLSRGEKAKRPRNSFFLYKDFYLRALLDHRTPRIKMQEVNTMASPTWKVVRQSEFGPFFRQLAAQEKSEHKAQHPDYTFKDPAKGKSQRNSKSVSRLVDEVMISRTSTPAPSLNDYISDSPFTEPFTQEYLSSVNMDPFFTVPIPEPINSEALPSSLEEIPWVTPIDLSASTLVDGFDSDANIDIEGLSRSDEGYALGFALWFLGGEQNLNCAGIKAPSPGSSGSDL